MSMSRAGGLLDMLTALPDYCKQRILRMDGAGNLGVPHVIWIGLFGVPALPHIIVSWGGLSAFLPCGFCALSDS